MVTGGEVLVISPPPPVANPTTGVEPSSYIGSDALVAGVVLPEKSDPSGRDL
jgi:hypothetical protein